VIDEVRQVFGTPYPLAVASLSSAGRSSCSSAIPLDPGWSWSERRPPPRRHRRDDQAERRPRSRPSGVVGVGRLPAAPGADPPRGRTCGCRPPLVLAWAASTATGSMWSSGSSRSSAAGRGQPADRHSSRLTCAMNA